MEEVGCCSGWDSKLTTGQEAMMRSERNNTKLRKANKKILGLDNLIEVDPSADGETESRKSAQLTQTAHFHLIKAATLNVGNTSNE